MSKIETGMDPSMKVLAHEIKTPLAALRSCTDVLDTAFRKIQLLLGSQPAAGPEDVYSVIQESLRVSRLACDRLEALIQSVRADFIRTDLHRIIDNATTLLSCQMKGRVEVIRDYGGPMLIDCHPGQLHQVFMNLVLNAVQAIQGPGEIRIQTRAANENVHVAVSDNGPGIPPEIITKVFDSEFTTKNSDGGKGLGLWICRRIILEHGGQITVTSDVGKGATFNIVLPTSHRGERTPNG